VGRHDETAWVRPNALRYGTLVGVTFLVMVAFSVRVIGLDTLPASLSFDEGVDGLDALQLIQSRWLTPFLQNNFGRESLFLYIQGLLLQVIGPSVFSLRFASAVVGTLTIPLMYVVGRQMALKVRDVPPCVTRVVSGLLAAAGLTVCYWHVFFSRQALRAILLLPLLLSVVWLLGRADRMLSRGDRGGWSRLALAGVLLGISQYVYLAARLLPVLFFLWTLVWLLGGGRTRASRAVGMALFWGGALVTALPLAVYFVNNPHAFGARTAAIAVFNTESPTATLAANLWHLIVLHLGCGSWLARWPSLDPVIGLGLAVGMVVGIHRIIRGRSASLGLAWLSLGWVPVLLSRQDWDATTTVLRGIAAWPAVCLVAAWGWTVLIGLAHRMSILKRSPGGRRTGVAATLAAVAVVVVGSGAVSAHNYFAVWASAYDRPDGYSRPISGYLNGQTERLILCPNRFCTDVATAFLLQRRYPRLRSLDAETLRSRLDGGSIAFLRPVGGEMPSAWTLFDSGGEGQGTAYLLPQLTDEETSRLVLSVRGHPAEVTILGDGEGPIADVVNLDADATALWVDAAPVQPVNAVFDGAIRLVGYEVQPAVAQHGQPVMLRLVWQAVGPIDDDYDVFIHLFHLGGGQRVDQINQSLGSGILLHSHRWPVGLEAVEWYTLKLPPDAPEGAYRFEVGLYHRASLGRLAVARGDSGGIDADSLVLGKCLVQETVPSPPTLALFAPFEDSIQLLGLDIQLADPARLSVTLHWQASGTIVGDYTVFTHLVDPLTGRILAQQDNLPQHGTYPTWLWSPGEIVLDRYNLGLPDDDGQYTLHIGMYNGSNRQRLGLRDAVGDFVAVPLRLVGGRLQLDGDVP
jgi:hypothetical protein